MILFHFMSTGDYSYFEISCGLWQRNPLKGGALFSAVVDRPESRVLGMFGGFFPLNATVTEQKKSLMTRELLSASDQALMLSAGIRCLHRLSNYPFLQDAL